MIDVLVLAPAHAAEAVFEYAGVKTATYGSADEAARTLAGTEGPAILVSDGLMESELGGVARAVAGRTGRVIEVRSERWDGAISSPLSAACRGVISGFGSGGVAAALALLEREAVL